MLYQLSYSRTADKCSGGPQAVNKTEGGPAKAEPPPTMSLLRSRSVDPVPVAADLLCRIELNVEDLGHVDATHRYRLGD